MPDNIEQLEQQLTELIELINAEDFLAATDKVTVIQKALQHLFASELTDVEQNRLKALAQSYSLLLSSLAEQQQKIMHSIGKLDGVKSGNKIQKTYQID